MPHHYWINDGGLVNAQNAERREGITEEAALEIASENVLDELKIR